MSQYIVRPRQGGKTRTAVEWVLEGERTDSYPGWSRILICHSIEESARIRADYPDLDYQQVFSWAEWANVHPGFKPVSIAIDNADMILSRLLRGHTVSVITGTGEAI